MTSAILLAGGRGSRLGLRDKATLELHGTTLLESSLSALATHAVSRVAVVGPPRPDLVAPDGLHVIPAREDPPLGGPAAACAAGLQALGNGEPAELVLLLAVDLVRPDLVVARLLAGDPHEDGVILVDPQGRAQWLAAAVRRDALRAAVACLGDPRDRSMRDLLAPLDLARLPTDEHVTADIDTPADLVGHRLEH